MSNPLPSPTWKLEMADTTKFSYLAKDEDGNESRRGGMMRKCIVVVSFPLRNGTTDKVAFIKTSRSRNYRDTRSKKMQTEREVSEEFTRWFGAASAARALQALQF